MSAFNVDYNTVLCCEAPRTACWIWRSINKIIIIIGGVLKHTHLSTVFYRTTQDIANISFNMTYIIHCQVTIIVAQEKTVPSMWIYVSYPIDLGVVLVVSFWFTGPRLVFPCVMSPLAA